MNQLKKILALLLAFTLVLASCGKATDKEGSSVEGSEKVSEQVEESSEEASEEASTVNEKANNEPKPLGELDDHSLYLITDLGTIDDKSFNQAAFQGMKQYADEVGIKANYLRPSDKADQVYLETIRQAVDAGAKIIVTPGFLFQNSVGLAQSEFPDVRFICVDFIPVVPKEKGSEETIAQVNKNTVAILFREEQSGYLAGYAAVKDGYRNIGFMGGVAVPAVINFGFGYLAGANEAAKELNETVKVKYNYTGLFVESPEINTQAAAWYKKGTEVIFSCGGGIASSVLKAAQDNGGKMIGVDVDQKDMGEEVITSAMKNMQKAVYEQIEAMKNDTFVGGETLVLDIKDEAVQISDDFSRFNNFTEAEYKELYKKLTDNKDGLLEAIPRYNEGDDVDPTNIEGFTNLEIEYID